MKEIHSVTVFCSASEVSEIYMEPAVALAQEIANQGWDFVWGGSDSGMMSRMSSAAQESGAKIIGVSVDHLAHKAKESADEMTVTADTAQRRKLLIEKGDAIIIMPGGLGTLDEATEAIEEKKHGIQDKPIVFFNFQGFFDGIKAQLEHMDKNGFLPKPLDSYARFATSPDEVISLVKQGV